jgi:hypothetical protein
MSTRKDIMTPRKGRDDKTYWTRIGTAWFNDNGGIQLVFDALPIPDSEGRVVANLFDPKPREAQVPAGALRREVDALDDDVVF